jgi:hypothetical protein
VAEESIADRVKGLLVSLPAGVTLLAAAKTRTPEEVREAVEAGITDIGYNYVQEAETAKRVLGASFAQAHCVRWHLIGHLQHNKAKRAVAAFDVIQTVDSLRIALAIDRHCGDGGKALPILIEVNSGREPGKAGVLPEEAEGLVRQICPLPHLRVPDVEMRYLSMGMSDSYQVAVEEGANIVRIGTKLFGERRGD